MNFYFDLPLTIEGSNYLENLGILDHVIIWKSLELQMEEEFKNKDEDDHKTI
jgi:hypothetical protein